MLNGLPVLTGCDVTLSVAGKGKLPTRTAGNTMPHQLDVGPTVIAQCSRKFMSAILKMAATAPTDQYNCHIWIP